MPQYKEQQVAELVARDSALAAIYNLLVNIPIGRPVTVDRLVKDTGFAQRLITKALTQLEELGLGEFIWGRKGRPSRFHKTRAWPNLELEQEPEVESLTESARRRRAAPAPQVVSKSDLVVARAASVSSRILPKLIAEILELVDLAQRARPPLGEFLVRDGLVTEEDIAKALEQQASWQKKKAHA